MKWGEKDEREEELKKGQERRPTTNSGGQKSTGSAEKLGGQETVLSITGLAKVSERRREITWTIKKGGRDPRRRAEGERNRKGSKN